MARTIARHSFRMAALAACTIAAGFGPASAQGLDSEGAIDAIVGSDVMTEEANAEDERERVEAAIEASMDTAQIVRRAFNVNEVEIVFLPEVGAGETGISEKREEYADQILELQQAIEGSAIFYHAVNSRQIMVRDIVAIEFADENNHATIFVAGRQPGAEAIDVPAQDDPETPPAEPAPGAASSPAPAE